MFFHKATMENPIVRRVEMSPQPNGPPKFDPIVKMSFRGNHALAGLFV